MSNPTLTFNILTFKHPSDEYTFHFSNEEIENSYRVFHTLVPLEVKEHFGEQEHYYTQYTNNHSGLLAVTKKSKPTYIVKPEGDEKPVKEANTAFTNSLLKRYYNLQIHTYFKEIGILVKPNFIDDIEIWLLLPTVNPEYTLYEKYTLKVQFAMVSCQPELVITYAGQSKVFRRNVADILSDVSPKSLNWVLFEGNLYKYDEKPEEAERDLEKVFPVWNFDIRDDLNQPTDAPDRSNPYIKYLSHITSFYKKYLITEAFKSIIPIDSDNFISVNPKNIGFVSDNSNLLLFGNRNYHSVPYSGMDKHGPLELSPYKRIQFFFICHTSNTDKTKLLKEFLEKGLHQEKASFKGLYNFSKVPFYTTEGFSIVFQDINNPLAEIEKKLKLREFKDEIQYIAIYVSPHSKNNSDKHQKSVYYKIKELLLRYKITSQVVEAHKIITDYTYTYSLNNIAIAVLAKLNGVPWRLDTRAKNELIVGVGAFKNIDTDIQYIGSAFSFSNNGKFNRFECFMQNQIDELAGSIFRAVKEYVAVQSTLNRLVIHFYKQMNHKELDIIENGLHELNLDIPVFIVSINKTESHDVVAFDNTWKDLMPYSGTFINFGHNRFLLFNNTRYNGGTFRTNDGFPFPIKLNISCTVPELVKDYKTVKELLDQVYQFSRMYWKSVRQQNLPVTIKYPEMVAEMFPHFEGSEIPPFGKDNLWFL